MNEDEIRDIYFSFPAVIEDLENIYKKIDDSFYVDDRNKAESRYIVPAMDDILSVIGEIKRLKEIMDSEISY